MDKPNNNPNNFSIDYILNSESMYQAAAAAAAASAAVASDRIDNQIEQQPLIREDFSQNNFSRDPTIPIRGNLYHHTTIENKSPLVHHQIHQREQMDNLGTDTPMDISETATSTSQPPPPPQPNSLNPSILPLFMAYYLQHQSAMVQLSMRIARVNQNRCSRASTSMNATSNSQPTVGLNQAQNIPHLNNHSPLLSLKSMHHPPIGTTGKFRLSSNGSSSSSHHHHQHHNNHNHHHLQHATSTTNTNNLITPNSSSSGGGGISNNHHGFEKLDNLKPAHSYIGLIAMCILSSPEKRMVLNDIYQFILDNYPYYRNRGSGWRNSVRHNLSLNECFQKAGRAANGKGHYWTIHPANMEDFMLGDFRRRRAQRKVRRWNNMDVPSDESDDESMEDATKPPLPEHFKRSLEMHRQLELIHKGRSESIVHDLASLSSRVLTAGISGKSDTTATTTTDLATKRIC